MMVRVETAEQLSRVASAPVAVCRLVFAVAYGDPEGVALIRGGARDSDTLRQRRAVIWTAKLHTHASTPEIGRAVGMDHSAVLRAIDESKAAWLCDPAFRSECHRIGCRIPISLASMIGMDGETEERGRG